MKFKVTKKEMNSRYPQIIKIGYCDADNLLNFQEPIAYSTRVEGWACDYYDINGVLISTGYAPISKKCTYSSYELIKEYDGKAREIISNYDLKWEEKQELVNELLSQYMAKATTQEVK